MKLFYRSERSSQIVYTRYEGLIEAVVLNLMTDLGHTNIESVTEQEFIAAAAV